MILLVLSEKVYIFVFLLCLSSGNYDKGAVEVTNCFAVPHNESEEEVSLVLKLIFFLGNLN